jgi:DNA-binding MarR family transcriptional regulator
MDTTWLSDEEMAAWLRLVAMMELLPGALESQLRRDADLTHFEYYSLAILSAAPDKTLRMTALANRTRATLPRLSHVVRKLEDRGLAERFPCPADARATNVRLTDSGWDKVQRTAPGHVANVRRHVINALTAEQIGQLTAIGDAILRTLDPDGTASRFPSRRDPTTLAPGPT